METSSFTTSTETTEVIIVGAGFSGMYMTYKLRNIGLKVQTFEAGSDVGGVWYWNCYPGARCDFESIEYCYAFSKEIQNDWNWSERYSGQPEILSYAKYVADRFELRQDIQFNTKVTSAIFNEKSGRWDVTTDKGQQWSAQHFVMATGCLSSVNIPKFKGMDTFKGRILHPGNWPHDERVNFNGKRVGIIGTGSSAVQMIPLIAEEAAQLYVFQRTPNFVVPAHNRKLLEEEMTWTKENYDEIITKAKSTIFGLNFFQINPSPMSQITPEERHDILEKNWGKGGFHVGGVSADIITNQEANDILAAFIHKKIGETVKDPRVAELLMPRDHPAFTKRICVGTNYFETFNRENVTLVDIKSAPIIEITPEGLKTATYESFELDYIILATGYDAMTGSLTKIDIRGQNGLLLNEKWAIEGPRTYLGLMTAGFPNFFIIAGPGSPTVISSTFRSIEQQGDWIIDCISHLKEQSFALIEPTTAAENDWTNHVNLVANFTLYPKANSWYVGANIPGKPRIFMPYIGGFAAYSMRCKEIAQKGYEGFVLIKK